MATTTGLFPNNTAFITGSSGGVGALLTQSFSDVKLIPLHKDATPHQTQTLLHLAASTQNIVESNIIYLKESLELAKKLHVENIVFFSSMSVYGDQDQENIDEAQPLNHPNLYGISKYFGEQYLKESPFNILILRLPAVLTKQTQTYIANLLNDLQHNREITLTNHQKVFNNFISVRDIAHFLSHVKIQKKFEILNLASPQEPSLYEVVTYLKELSHSTSKITILNTKKRYYNININKAVVAYNFQPSPYKISLKQWWDIRNER